MCQSPIFLCLSFSLLNLWCHPAFTPIVSRSPRHRIGHTVLHCVHQSISFRKPQTNQESFKHSPKSARRSGCTHFMFTLKICQVTVRSKLTHCKKLPAKDPGCGEVGNGNHSDLSTCARCKSLKHTKTPVDSTWMTGLVWLCSFFQILGQPGVYNRQSACYCKGGKSISATLSHLSLCPVFSVLVQHQSPHLASAPLQNCNGITASLVKFDGIRLWECTQPPQCRIAAEVAVWPPDCEGPCPPQCQYNGATQFLQGGPGVAYDLLYPRY